MAIVGVKGLTAYRHN